MQVRPKGTLSNNKQHRELTKKLVSWLLQEEREQVSFVSIQWNVSSKDTNGAEDRSLFSEVSSFQGLKCMKQ